MNRHVLWLVSVIAGISVLHHVTPETWGAAHEALRRAFYFPVLVGAVSGGPALGVGLAITAAIAYAPHFLWASHIWVTPVAPHVADGLLLPAIGLAAGISARRVRRFRARAQRSMADAARKEAQIDDLISAQADADRHLTLGRIVGAGLPSVTRSCELVRELISTQRADASVPSDRYELGVATRELNNVLDVLHACDALVSADRSSRHAETADTVRLAGQLARVALRQRDGAVEIDEPLPAARIAIPRDVLLRVLVGLALEASHPGARVRVRARRAGRDVAFEVHVAGRHVAPAAFYEPLHSSEAPAVLPALRALVYRAGGSLEARLDGEALLCEIRLPLAELTSTRGIQEEQ